MLNRMHADLASGETREIALKTASDGWLVGRLSGAREIYNPTPTPNPSPKS